MASTKQRANYDELREVPDPLVAELVHGSLRTRPRPRLRHARTASRLGQVLGSPFDRGFGGPGGWILLDEPELHLDVNVLVPDLAGWRRERMPELPDEPFTTLAPDWLCEVLSPSTAALDRTEKMPIYVAGGVKHAWLVDPAARTLEVFRAEAGHWSMIGAWRDAARVEAEPFVGFTLDLSELWAG